MPWKVAAVETTRREFVALATAEGANVRALCVRFAISPKTGYKWIARVAAGGELADRSRAPKTSPRRTAEATAERVVALRLAHPTWGGRKLHHALRREGLADTPAPSTITDILRRAGLLAAGPAGPRPWQRFEAGAPNDLWQLDFMGHRPLAGPAGGRVHPLTLVDDHARFALGLTACPTQRRAVVQAELERVFRRFGLPTAILADNGPPWGATGGGGVTGLEAWLLRLGVQLWHGRPYHPQTQGKVERLHRTIAADVFAHAHLADLAAAQAAFDAFRHDYNHARPHQALGYAVPAARYAPSPRGFPAAPPPPEYRPDDAVRKVRDQGAIGFRARSHFVGRGLIGEHVAVRPTAVDGVFAVVYCRHQVGEIDLR